jgi:N-acetylglucosaminyl-diphospho-decaprenol L-rhamnosyltransferase
VSAPEPERLSERDSPGGPEQPSEPAARVSAIVVNYKSRDLLLGRCLPSLRAEGVEEIVVVDNDSGDGIETALRAADPTAVFVQTGANFGFGGGVNRGAARTERELLLVINPDAFLEPGSLKAVVEAFDRDPKVGIVGPGIREPGGARYPSPRRFPTIGDATGHALFGLVAPNNRFTRRYRMLDDEPLDAATADWVSGSCFAIRRRAWDDIAGFDERYFMYAEDMDLCWRAHTAGWHVVFEPAASATHVQGASTDQRPYRMILEHHRALLRFTNRTTTGVSRLLLPAIALGLAARVPLAWAHRIAAGRRGNRPGRQVG